MKFYSGFSLQNEAYLFREYIRNNEYSISGFSYGAIFALKETIKRLKQKQRVDTLTLLSPAFFQTKDKRFKRLQLISYNKNRDAYMQQFIKSCFDPYEKKIIEHKQTSAEELEELLEYEWSHTELEFIESCGVNIEVYLGGQDKIIDALSSKKFFLEYATVTYINDANHFLQTN